jgi:uncharacterized protein
VDWLNEPAKWSTNGSDVLVSTEASTDFWRVTGESPDAVRDNGHLYGEMVSGNFDLTVDVQGEFSEQYDQAGVMVRLDDRQWFKTGIEWYEGSPRFSTVVTFGYSNWMLTDIPEPFDRLGIRVAYQGNAVEVYRSINGGTPEFSAHLYVPPGEAKFVGIMSAAPKGSGFDVTFRNFVINQS